MPTLHPQASFEPIPPHLDLDTLVDITPNFDWALRISAAQVRSIGPHEFEKLVRIHVIQGGKPLVIDKWNELLNPSLFSAQWLESAYDKKQENVRDLVHQVDIPMTTGHYLRSMKQLTNQWTANNYRDERRQRLYLKDIDCPPEWHDRLQKIVPPHLFYFNENVETRSNELSDDARSPAAPAGDLMSSLPEEMRAQNLMCYIGHEGTYTPAHREMCASLGQNIMVDASGDEKGEKPGSSIWFMTESKDREVVREYFLSMLGHDIEIEKHFAQINAWKKASFPVYVVEQRVGDFILVPPLAPHQVWNRGTRTVKVAWNRTSVDTLELALSEALPKARLVCRDEQYKNKAIIYFTLKKYCQQMEAADDEAAEMSLLGINEEIIRSSVRMRQLAQDFKRLFHLFAAILVDEMFGTKERDVELIEFDSNITCSYCRCNIFNRFLTCKHCVRDLTNGDQDTYDICMECYAMGRSCVCISGLGWCEQWQWSGLVDDYEAFRAMVIKNDGFVDLERSPLPLELARKTSGKKSVAQICQEQLRQRPWKDITKPEEPSEPEPLSEPEVAEDGRTPKKKRKGRKRKKGDVSRCHVCCHKDYKYKLASCTTCTENYCYGVLYRAFDSMPQAVMEDEQWQCPKCRKICNCGSCRRLGITNPYTPKMTLLGHDTRAVADDRSVESLVDFRLHNLNWLKASGDDPRNQHSRRLQKLKEVANAEKAKEDHLANSVELPEEEIARRLQGASQEPTTNGYGDQDDIAEDGAAADGYHAHAEDQDTRDVGASSTALIAVADMSPDGDTLMSFADMSSYPDPSMLGHERMIGMGYYDQDESEDRILFDPYQAPSADSLAAKDESSEFVKKAIRAAKRKARHEDDDDPDFAGPKTAPKKLRRVEMGTTEPMDNMDPALLAAAVAPIPAAAVAVENETGGSLEAGAPEDEETPLEVSPETGENTEPFSVNHPKLRHARPNVSYAEEDDGLDDVLADDDDASPTKDAVTEKVNGPVAAGEPGSAKKDPLDLAADAIRALTGAAPATEDKAEERPATTAAVRPRGRPGRPRKTDPGPATALAAEVQQPRKKRGRPPRASLPVRQTKQPAEPDQEDVDSMIQDLEQQLARELAEADENGAPESAGKKPSPAASATVGPKRRGRPPKARPAVVAAAAAEPESAPSAVQVEISTMPSTTTFLSMAERMAMQGKKFKIGKRKEPVTPEKPKESIVAPAKEKGAVASGVSKKSPVVEDKRSPATKPTAKAPLPVKSNPIANSGDDDEFVPDQEASSIGATPSSATTDEAPPPPRRFAGPTIVRLMDSDEEDDDDNDDDDSNSSVGGEEEEEAMESEDSSDGYEDIPNRRPLGNFARRGGAVGARGRGGGRGRGRGRPRGRGRA